MSSATKVLEPAFQGVGQKVGTEIWRIEDFQPVPLPRPDYGKFYMGDSYIILQTTQGKGGAYLYDIHFWIGKDTSQVSLHFTLPYFQLLSCSVQFLRKVIVSSFVFMFLPVSLFFPFVFSFWF